MGCAGSAPRPNAKPTSAALGAVMQPQAQHAVEAIELQMDGVEGVSKSLLPQKGKQSHEAHHGSNDPSQVSKYFTLDGLLEPVESGAIAAIKGSWLVAQHQRGGVLARRQDLPPEAFWTADELRSLAERLGDDYGYLFVALSYRWLSREHPDPNGFHLRIVASVLRMYLGGGGTQGVRGDPRYPADKSPLSWAFKKAGLHLTGEWGANEDGAALGDCALFWDFGSLFQQPRTEEQIPLFGAGLKASNHLDQLLAVWEWRLGPTPWLIMRPRLPG